MRQLQTDTADLEDLENQIRVLRGANSRLTSDLSAAKTVPSPIPPPIDNRLTEQLAEAEARLVASDARAMAAEKRSAAAESRASSLSTLVSSGPATGVSTTQGDNELRRLAAGLERERATFEREAANSDAKCRDALRHADELERQLEASRAYNRRHDMTMLTSTTARPGMVTDAEMRRAAQDAREAGWRDGFSAGSRTGKDEGHIDGRDSGWKAGWSVGREQGRREGEEIGQRKGRDEGFNAGLDSGRKESEASLAELRRSSASASDVLQTQLAEARKTIRDLEVKIAQIAEVSTMILCRIF